MNPHKRGNHSMYGVLAKFSAPEELVAAVQRARQAGYTNIEAYTPFPVQELAVVIHTEKSYVPLLTLLGGIIGCVGGFGMQWYTATIDYPLNIGGRPLLSWPSFIPITFELTILGASLAAVIGMLLLNGLPRLNHPLFQIHEFELASRNSFFLCLRQQSQFDTQTMIEFVNSLQPRQSWEVP